MLDDKRVATINHIVQFKKYSDVLKKFLVETSRDNVNR